MNKLNQKEAVFSAVSKVLSENGVRFEEGQDAKTFMTKEYRAQANNILFEGIRAGEIEFAGEKSDSELKTYVSGLQSNWLNKDKRLNGNVSYVAKNPGSRQGQQDPQIKALRALLSTKSDEDEIAEIQSYIDDRLTVIGTEKKAKTVEIDFDALPTELQAKYTA